jgi:putative spermidine/putrescine transport system ATP-binding protein
MAFVELQNITAGYERDNPVLQGFYLSVDRGELVSLLGPSGCGKTTTLRTIAGFIEPDGGSLRIGDKDVTRVPPNKRNIGLVFQSYALFPHLSVFENVAFGLKMRGVAKAEIGERVQRALDLVDLGGYEKRLPAQLSGGQRQRVALSRAIVIEPDLLLLDEPLSNLDAKLRVGMREELSRLQRQLGITMVYVTHDQVEALSLSDRVVVMNRGRIEQIAPPEELYTTPATAFVAQFMGCDNSFPASYESPVESGEAEESKASAAGPRRIWLRAGGTPLLVLPHRMPDVAPGEELRCYGRPEEFAIFAEDGDNRIPGKVVFRSFQGANTLITVETEVGELQVVSDRRLRREPGEQVYVQVPSESLVLAGA